MKFIAIAFLITISACFAKDKEKEKENAPKMVSIPEGEFIMGSNDGLGGEKPERKIRLKSFYIDKYEVSSQKYKKFVDSTGYKPPKEWFFKGYDSKRKNFPITFIDYNDAKKYCNWTGKRLPTEKEWEKAARGTNGIIYPWGNKFDSNKANTSLSKIVGTVPVDSYTNGVSPYGIYNMAGNVWEWTSTPWQDENRRIVKGGSWGLSHRFSRSFSRIDYSIKDKTNNIGFRCASDS